MTKAILLNNDKLYFVKIFSSFGRNQKLQLGNIKILNKKAKNSESKRVGINSHYFCASR